MDCDVVIVGGGPIGLATAIFAQLAGLRARVFDRRSLPLDKACGEGLMPRGAELLRTLGVRLDATHVRPFQGIRFLAPGHCAEGRFAHGPGLGIRRTALIAGLHERAAALGAELHYGCGVQGWENTDDTQLSVRTNAGSLRSQWLVGADGLHSGVRRRAGLALPRRGRRRFGVRRHYTIEPWSSFVEVHWSDLGEAYVTPVGGNEVGVALLWNGDGRRYDELLASFPQLAARLRHAVPASPTFGAGPFAQRVRRPYAGRVALVGDAAGYIDPLTGEGLTIGLLSAQVLATTLATSGALADYARAQRRITRDYRVVTRLMLTIAARPWLRQRLIAAFERTPEAFDRCVSILGGASSLGSFGVGATAKLLAGVVVG